jgi:hypothetical protein
LKFERFDAKVVSIDIDEMTVIVEGCEWADEYKYTDDAEHVLVESILNNSEVNMLAQECKKTKRIVEADYIEEEDD